MNTLTRILSFFFKDFERVFFIREYTALAGRNQKVLITLSIILFFTFLALGFAYGSLVNLEKKMNNPYTNWVDLPVTEKLINRKAGEIFERYNTPEIASQFDLKNTNGFSKYVISFHQSSYQPFLHAPDTLKKTVWGRTIETDESLFAEILDPKNDNLIWVAEDFDMKEFGGCDIIVTRYLLEQLEYENLASGSHLMIRQDSADLIFLRIVAVVEELPNFCRFISTPKLYNILIAKKDGSKECDNFVAGNRVGDNNFSLLTDNSNTFPAIDSLAQVYFPGKRPSITSEQAFIVGQEKHQAFTLSFMPSDAPSLDSIKAFISWAKLHSPVSFFSSLECAVPECNNLYFTDYHYLAFNFERLNSVRSFRADLYDEFKVEIDVSQVEAKENFALVSRLTYIICLILMVFAASNIVFFVNNLLRTHLFEVRSNLGTFQAFGLSNHFLVRIYLKIIFAFLTISVFTAFLLSIIVDRLEQVWRGSESTFDVFNSWIPMSLIGLYIVSLLLVARTIRAISGDTPGNLIYKR